jgi:UDP-glucose 4-epimerase
MNTRIARQAGMNVLVTGGAGYIGSICVEKLLDANCRVTVFDNLSEGHRAAVDPRAELIVGDLLDTAALAKAFTASQPEAVLHFAASALIGESMRAPEKYFRNNVTTGLNLLDAMIGSGVKRLVFSSSCATYGLPDSMPVNESMPQSPINPYGESKLIFEQMLRWYEQAHGLMSVGLRFFNVAGASPTRGEDHRVETHLIPNVLKVALGQKDSVGIFGVDYDTPDGTCVRDYVHVLDVAAAHLMALGAKTSGFYNLGNGVGYSVGDIVGCCRHVTGHPIPVLHQTRRAGAPSRLVADFSKIEGALGWRPRQSSLQEIVASAWAWHQRCPNGYGDTNSDFPTVLKTAHPHSAHTFR